MRFAHLLIAPLALCACGSADIGAPPSVSELRVITAPPARGAPIRGDFVVADGDGLPGVAIRLDVRGGAEATLMLGVPDATRATKVAQVPFMVNLPATANAGSYTISVVAADVQGLASLPLIGTMQVQ